MTILSRASLVVPLVAALGCSGEPASDEDTECTDEEKCDLLSRPDSEIVATPCDGVIVDMSGRNHQKVAGRLRDPFAFKALRNGTDCPTTFADMMAKLRQHDTENCPTSDPRAGIDTRFVSETAQASGRPTSYRAVTTRTCGTRKTHSIMFSLFGVRANAAELPGNVEVIAFDASSGVFNYYETDGQTIQFFGNSKDMLAGASGEVRRCATCHTGGGLIMKELDTPWLHWEGHMNTPGTNELIAKFEDLGREQSGAELEFVVKEANDAWNSRRLSFLRRNGTPKDILRPLFCTQEINLDNGADFESPVAGGPGGDELRRIPFDSLLDPRLARFGSLPVSFADYDALLKEHGQTVSGVPGAIDTVFDYVFVERSHADDNYVGKLISSGIIDEELARDVLLVDLTRPVFSDDRCALLDFVPSIRNSALNPASVRDGLIANLTAAAPAAGSPAADLLANLQATGGHSDKVNAFTAACGALPSRDFLKNAMTVTSGNRDRARELPVMEFPPTMPDDNLDVAPGTRLDPTSCQLTTSFVALN
jgi:hypothetical protein